LLLQVGRVSVAIRTFVRSYIRTPQLDRNQLDRHSWTGTSYSHETGSRPTGFLMCICICSFPGRIGSYKQCFHNQFMHTCLLRATPSSSPTDPWAPSASHAEKVPPGPANPGCVRNCPKGVLARLPPDCDILEEVAQLRRNENLSDEQVILKFMSTYDVTLATLNQISGNVYPTLLYRNLSNIPQSQGCPHRLATSNMRK